MGIFNNIMEKVKTKFNGTSPTNIEQQSKIDNALSNNKTITINSPKSERYTYLPGTAGKWLEKFKPESKEEKDTLAPIGFFRVGERETERQKKVAERIRAAASLMGRDELTPDQAELVTKQAEREMPYTQDIPSTAIKKMKYDPRTKELWVTFNGSNKKYWYPRVPKEKIEEMMTAPSKGEYFLNNIHDQYSVNYQLHGTHSPQSNKASNRAIKNIYKKMQKTYSKGMKQGTMKGVLNK
jgi:hypothetical protein